MDSIVEIGAYAFLQHNKGNLLYFAARAQLTMDYSSKAVKDGVVDSPSSHGIPIPINSPSPLQRKAMLKSSKSIYQDIIGAHRNLYLGLSPVPNCKSLIIQLL